MLILDALAYKTEVQVVQEKYFDGYPNLWCDVETALEKTTQTILDAGATFNESLKNRAEVSSREKDQEDQPKDRIGVAREEDNLVLNIEAIRDYAGTMVDSTVDDWVERAQRKAVIDILEETGEHEEFVLKRLRKKFEPIIPRKNWLATKSQSQ